MTWLDSLLQDWRIHKARPFLSSGARVLDIGCTDGALFKAVQGLGPGCLGIDPTLPAAVEAGRFRLVRGSFPKDMPDVAPFDAITMLAVLEHFPAAVQTEVAAGCARFLRPGGWLIITVPSPRVDDILKVLHRLRLIHGMLLEEHHDYDVRETVRIFAPPHFALAVRQSFQLGLNNLFVFRR